jgi:hypothetical protein
MRIDAIRRMRLHVPQIALVLGACFVFSLMVSSVARGVEARDALLFGEKGLVLCVSENSSDASFPDHQSQSHHMADCCILCASGHSIRVVDMALMQSRPAYEPLAHFIPQKIIIAILPDIALSDGVYPHDIPARAPPLLIV